MSPTLERLRNEALTLPSEERLNLADSLYESLEERGQTMALSSEWMTEINRRSQEIEDGVVELIDEEEVERELRQMVEHE